MTPEQKKLLAEKAAKKQQEFNNELVETFERKPTIIESFQDLQEKLNNTIARNQNFYDNETPIEIKLSDSFSMIVPTKVSIDTNIDPIWYLKYKKDDLKVLNLSKISDDKDMPRQNKYIPAYEKNNILLKIQKYNKAVIYREMFKDQTYDSFEDRIRKANGKYPPLVENNMKTLDAYEYNNLPSEVVVNMAKDIYTLSEAFENEIGNSEYGLKIDVLEKIDDQIEYAKNLRPENLKRKILTTDKKSERETDQYNYQFVDPDNFLHRIAQNSSPNRVALTAKDQVNKDFNRFLLNKYTEELTKQAVNDFEYPTDRGLMQREDEFAVRNMKAIHVVINETNHKLVNDFIKQEAKEKSDVMIQPYKNMAVETVKTYKKSSPNDKLKFEKAVLKAAQRHSYVKRPGDDYLIDKNQKPFTSNNIYDLRNDDGTLKDNYHIVANHDGLLTIEPKRFDTKNSYTIDLNDVKESPIYQKAHDKEIEGPSIIDELVRLREYGFDVDQEVGITKELENDKIIEVINTPEKIKNDLLKIDAEKEKDREIRKQIEEQRKAHKEKQGPEI